MSKSVVIIGKGPSVLSSTKEFIDSFDEVSICNFPPMEGYEKYIGNKAKYHFFNSHDPNPYRKEILNKLGLEYIFNTHHTPHDGYKSSFPDHKVEYVRDYGKKVIPWFKYEYDFDPSAGIQAFDYFVTRKEFSTIGLAGFDFFKIGEKGYYFSVKEVQESWKYLFRDFDDESNRSVPYDKEGTRKRFYCHGPEKSEKYVYDMIEYYGKELRCRK